MTPTLLPTVPRTRVPYLPRFEDLAAELELRWPLDPFGHDVFLARIDQAGWLEGLEVELTQLRGAQALARNTAAPDAGTIPASATCPCSHRVAQHGQKGCRGKATCGCARTQQRARTAIAEATR